MPDTGTEDSEVRIVGWLVTAGDEVAEGDPICVVSVDGQHAEVLSSSAGRVAELLVGVDAQVYAGASLAELEPVVDMASFHSPAVRRLAAEHGIDLTQIAGTGRNGRIRREDVQRAAEPQHA